MPSCLARPKADIPVDQAEVDRFRRTPLVRVDLFGIDAENLGGCRPMHVLLSRKALMRPVSPDSCAMIRSSICE